MILFVTFKGYADYIYKKKRKTLSKNNVVLDRLELVLSFCASALIVYQEHIILLL